MNKNILVSWLLVSLLVLVFLLPFGNSGGFFQEQEFHINGTTNNMDIGFNAHGGYDFNGDGQEDFLITGVNDTVLLFYGSSTNLYDNTTASSNNVTFIGSAGVGGEITYFGGDVGNKTNGATFIGDFNNDSFDDVLITAYLFDASGVEDAGQAYIFFGNPNNNGTWSYLDANYTINGTHPLERLGYDRTLNSRSKRSDLNSDNISDILLTSRAFRNSTEEWEGSINTSAVYVFYGTHSFNNNTLRVTNNATSDSNATFIANFQNTTLNNTLAALDTAIIGDINGDGVDDFAIGAPLSSNESGGAAGQVFVFFGNFTFNEYHTNITFGDANISFNGTSPYEQLTVLGYVGDFDNDTFDDLILGANTTDHSILAGTLYLILGSANITNPPRNYLSPLNFSNMTINGTSGNSTWAQPSVGAFGRDISGDQIVDLIIGDNFARNATRVFSGTAFNGRTEINDTDANFTITGPTDSEAFGVDVAVFDADDDGVGEIIIGDREYQNQSGRVIIYDAIRDDLAPNVTIYVPENATIHIANSLNLNVSFNYTLNDTTTGLDVCWIINTSGGNETLPDCIDPVVNRTILVKKGSNNLTLYANDTQGNLGEFVVYFHINTTTKAEAASTSSVGGGVSGGGGGPKISAGEVKSLGKLGVYGATREMASSSQVTFSVNEESHSAIVKSVNKEKGEVEIEVASTPQTVIVKLGETKNVDLDGNRYADIAITLSEITNAGNAVLKFVRLEDGPLITSEPVKQEVKEVSDEVPEERPSPAREIGRKLAEGKVGEVAKGTPWWAWVVLLLVLGGAGYWLYYKNRHK